MKKILIEKIPGKSETGRYRVVSEGDAIGPDAWDGSGELSFTLEQIQHLYRVVAKTFGKDSVECWV